MNHYPRHIGDILTATVGLSLMERGAYDALIDQYYAREAPLPVEKKEVYRLAAAVSPQERKAVDYVLGRFFQLESDGWHQRRCDEELARFWDKSGKAKASAKTRWANTERNANAYANAPPDAMRTHSEGNASHKPVANSQDPVDQKHRSPSGSRLTVETLPDEWRSYCKTERPELNPDRVFLDFSDYWKAKAGKDGRKADWAATWRGWVRRQGSFGSPATGPKESLFERNLRAVGIEPERAG